MPRGSGDVGFVHMGDGHDDQRQALDDEGYTYTGGGGDDPAAPQRRVAKTVVAPVPHTLPPKVTAIPPLPTRPTTFSPATDAGGVTKGRGVADTRSVTTPPAGFSRHPKYGYFVQPEEESGCILADGIGYVNTPSNTDRPLPLNPAPANGYRTSHPASPPTQPGLTNSSKNDIVYVKPEGNIGKDGRIISDFDELKRRLGKDGADNFVLYWDDQSVPVPPGKSFPWPIDGFTKAGWNGVYKVITMFNTGVFVGEGRDIFVKHRHVNDLGGGGFKTFDFLKLLQDGYHWYGDGKKDGTWNNLFDSSRTKKL
jgi:hypothetical protein